MANEHVTSGAYTFSQHMALARAWCRCLGPGPHVSHTQILRAMRAHTAEELAGLLRERGVALPTGCEL